MTNPISIPNMRQQNPPVNAGRILVIAQDPEMLTLVREALSSNGYSVVEARSYNQAEAILDQFGSGLNLILGCSDSDQETSKVEKWHTSHRELPLLVMRTTDQSAREFLVGEIVFRVRLALEAAAPSRSIVVVTEDESERRFLAHLLTTAGYRVAQAPNGKEALTLLAQNPPDLLHRYHPV